MLRFLTSLRANVTSKLLNKSHLEKLQILKDPQFRTFSTHPPLRNLETILHGDKSLPQAADVAYSKILARGKYVHELQTHFVKPECLSDYIDLASKHYSRVKNDPRFDIDLLGSWTTEVGDLDSVRHIFEYSNYQGMVESQKLLAADLEHQAFLRKVAPLLRSRHNQILLEFAYWVSVDKVKQLGGIYELRTYRLKVVFNII